MMLVKIHFIGFTKKISAAALIEFLFLYKWDGTNYFLHITVYFYSQKRCFEWGWCVQNIYYMQIFTI